MTDEFKDKVVIVTGGASGIGKALCQALARADAQVVVADIDLALAQRLAAEISSSGGRARAQQVDVSDLDLVKKLVADTVADLGRLDYMFNNAAATATRGELYGLPIEPWHRAIDVNLFGVVYGTVAAYEVMVRQGAGHIVNTSSLAGLVGFPTSIPYGASKAAVVNLSVALRTEAADLGVKVSVVCPGPVHGETSNGATLMGVDRAAERMLKGVKKNQALIVFPFSARFLWWIYRLSPNLVMPIGRRIARSAREKRLRQEKA